MTHSNIITETLRSHDSINARTVMARPTIKAMSLVRCRRWIGSSDSKRDGEEAGVAAEAMGGAGGARR
jgi:hypothetical protein